MPLVVLVLVLVLVVVGGGVVVVVSAVVPWFQELLNSSRAAEYSTRHAERFIDSRTGMNCFVPGVGLFSAVMYSGDVSVERDETS